MSTSTVRNVQRPGGRQVHTEGLVKLMPLGKLFGEINIRSTMRPGHRCQKRCGTARGCLRSRGRVLDSGEVYRLTFSNESSRTDRGGFWGTYQCVFHEVEAVMYLEQPCPWLRLRRP